jgi:predicted site-specific integrase-resolvase
MALRYLSTTEAAEAIGVSPNTIRAYIDADDDPLPAFNISGDDEKPRWRINEDDLRAYMSKRPRPKRAKRAAGAA